MTDITIPPEAVEAAARADYENWRDLYAVRGDTLEWEDLEPQLQNEHRSGVTAAIRAALKAWLNQHVVEDDVVYILNALILPLTEKPNAEA